MKYQFRNEKGEGGMEWEVFIFGSDKAIIGWAGSNILLSRPAMSTHDYFALAS